MTARGCWYDRDTHRRDTNGFAEDRMIRKLGVAVGVLVVAVVLALASVWWALLRAPPSSRIVTVGPWQTSLVTGSVDADIHTRARIAIGGLFALNRAEAIYFGASQDDDHKPLRARCTYLVEGRPVAARWWSVTAYADDMFLFDTPNQHYSLNGTTARLDANGRFALTTGGKEQPGTHWLPTPGDRGMVLTLRLYNPEPELQAAPKSLPPPTIEAVGVCV